MTYSRTSRLIFVLVACVGCGGPAAKTDGGPADTPGSDHPPAGDATTDQPIDTQGNADADAGADGPLPPGPDCFPECIAALRRSCQRPPYGAGSCIESAAASGSVICYSNGVREIRGATVDGGTTVQFTQADGQTICYVVVIGGTGQSWRTPAGQEVAQVVSTVNGTWDVTCSGSTVAVSVDIDDPTCRTLNSADCTFGVCP
jgi:hypothetical protein